MSMKSSPWVCWPFHVLSINDFFFFHSPVIKDLVNAEIDHNSRVVVIATSKSHDSLHPSLLTSRGCHIFQCCVELHPPDANQRQEILHAMINKRFPQEDSQELEFRYKYEFLNLSRAFTL